MNTHEARTSGIRTLTIITVATATLSLSACGGGGGSGTSNNKTPANNPVPTASTVSPSSITAGSSAAVKLTVHGSNFIKGSSILLSGGSLQTQYVSNSEITAMVPDNVITTPGTYQISVYNPAPGGGGSNPLNFQVDSFANPIINSITPSDASPGGPTFTLTVSGSGFSTESAIRFNNNELKTTFISSTKVSAPVPSTDIVSTGTDYIDVMNPYPTGALSKTATLEVGYSSQTLDQHVTDMITDPNTDMIYLSVPDTAVYHPNTISVLDPATDTITASYPAGSSPDRLALSSDGGYLYAGLDGANSIQRFLLPGFSKDINIPLGADSFLGPYYAMSIAAAPGAPHTIAVSLGNTGVSPAAEGGVVIFDDATPRTNQVPGFSGTGNLFDSLQWGSTDTTLYAANNEDTGFDFYIINVGSSGATLAYDYGGVFTSFFQQIHYAPATGLLYSDDGQVVDPITGVPAGKYAASGIMTPVASLNKVFFVGQTQAQFGSNYYTVESFNMSQYTPIASIAIGPTIGNPTNIVAWSNGLAISMSNGQIFNITGQFFSTPAPSNAMKLLQARILYNTWSNKILDMMPRPGAARAPR